MFQANIVPGQGFLPFSVYRKEAGLTPSGRAVESGYGATGQGFYGLLVNANQKEIDQWKQNGHPITHKIIQYSGEYRADATDALKLETRAFYVQGTKNPATMGLTRIYYVEERLDIVKELV